MTAALTPLLSLSRYTALFRSLLAASASPWAFPPVVSVHSCPRLPRRWSGTESVVLDAFCHISRILDRKSTRLNSSHVAVSYGVFCLKKKHRRAARPCHRLRRA